jgi:hypothetical protein
MEITMITIWIESIGRVQATLLQRYPDGDVRVTFQGRTYICKEAS